MKKEKKKLLIIGGVILAIILLAIGGWLIITKKGNDSKDTKPVNKEIVVKDFNIENGMTLEEIKEYLKENYQLGDNIEITYIGIDEDNKDQVLEAVTLYFNQDGEEVSAEEALEIVNDEEQLKEGFTKKEVLVGTGKYKATIKDKDNDKEYETVVTLEDKEAPVLELQDVTITEGDSLKINAFVKKCYDNSHEECILNYVDDNEEVSEEIDVKVGERTVKIIASDKAGNKSEVQEGKLVVNKKKTSTSTTTNKPSSSGTGSNNSTGSNNGVATTDTSKYTSSNPIVKAALGMVGMTGVPCTNVAETALNAVGKTLSIDIYEEAYNIITGEKLGTGKEAYEKTQQDTVFCTEITGVITDGQTNERCYYSVNNKIYRVTIKTCKNGECDERDDTSDIGQYYIGYKPFHDGKTFYWTEANIQKIGTQIPISEAQPGDFIFWENGGLGYTHIAFYLGNNQAVHGGWGDKREVVIAGIYVDKRSSTPTAWRVSY